jgi:carnitine 3-dehydrogenase
MAEVRKAACIGAGVIGAGWAARLLWHGIDVAVFDPHPEAERRCRAVVDQAEQSLLALHGARPGRAGRLTFATSLREAVADAGLVQESAPEREDVKRTILAEIDAAAPADALVGSSTSGLLPSRLQAEMARPGRFLVSHPFNPVYLLPLVELCAGGRTDPATVARAGELYAAVGMKPLVVRKEIDGFVADRLLEALWREALWLVNDDVATVAEVDDAVRYGAGLRWALMGTFQAYRIAGGEEGMRHFMAQFGPALQWPWTKLTDVPELTVDLLDKIAGQSDAQAEGRSVRDLERERDAGLVAILKGLRAEGLAAGALLPPEAPAADAALPAPDLDAPSPLALLRRRVPDEAGDYNGHMTEAWYLRLFAEAGDALLAAIGLDAAVLAGGESFFTAETHLMHLGEVRCGETVLVTTQVLGADGKRLHAFHRMWRGDDLVATAEQLYLHVDTHAGKVRPAEGAILEAMTRLAAAHAGLDRPESAGRSIASVPRR